MIEITAVQALKRHLFAGGPGTVFTILDGASVPDLPQNLATYDPDHVCLYRGELGPDMAEVAPYLVILEQDSPFTDWVLANGWGRHWGIFGTTQAELPSLKKHFQNFIMVHDETGRSLYFRYYDPRVLRRYLPTCQPNELTFFSGPVESYFIEDQDPTDARKFSFAAGSLQEDVFPVL
jgi:hypothetical protein